MSKLPGQPTQSTLEHLRATFDTTDLLRLVDLLDEVCVVLAYPDALRADMLRLHAMAHAVISGGPLSVASSPAALGELATEISMEADRVAALLAAIRRGVQPLEALTHEAD
ncbi:MAG: hypothetical protein B7X39_19630 [Lysobacterales bacterium 14-68-21]|jgi:hypothetical protein|nr:MAG: hypothetical protein B7X39_19630 [Xanthomonadales bacterium 14-68-21]